MEVLYTLAAVAGALLGLTITANIVRTLVIARARRTVLFDAVDQGVDFVFRMASWPLRTYERKDTLLAAQGAAVVLVQLMTWLLGYELAYALLLVPTVHWFPTALREAGSSMFTLGFVYTHGNEPAVIDILAAATGMIVVALQIAYLPTLYGAFNRRETEVTLLGARAGHPPWGPELLLRTRYGVAVRSDDLPAFYNRWERWAADVAESHSNYPVLVRFRSPHPLDSWLVGLLSVMDSAAMLLALRPSQDRIEPRRAIRMGFTALREISGALGMPVDIDPDPDSEIAISFEEFAAAVDQLRAGRVPRGARSGGGVAPFPWLAGQLRGTGLCPRLPHGPGASTVVRARRWGAETIPVQRPSVRSPGKGLGPVKLDGKGQAESQAERPGEPSPAP